MKKPIFLLSTLLFLVAIFSGCTGRYYRGSGYYGVHHRSHWGGFHRYHRGPIIVVPPGGGPDIDRPEAVQLPVIPDEPVSAPMPDPMPDMGMPDMDIGDIGDIDID